MMHKSGYTTEAEYRTAQRIMQPHDEDSISHDELVGLLSRQFEPEDKDLTSRKTLSTATQGNRSVRQFINEISELAFETTMSHQDQENR